MAQTKKKRRTKHRGNAAGAVVARGRTGRKPEPSPDKKPANRREAAEQRRADRYDKPPSWRSAFNRALIAAVIFFVLVLIVFDKPIAAALPLAVFMIALYTPLGYYTDLWIYRRRQAKKLAAKTEGNKRS